MDSRHLCRRNAVCICLLLNILFNDCLSLVYTMIHIKFYRLKFHGGVSVMASTKHYVALAMLKPGVAAVSEGIPCLLKHWLSG